MGNFSRNTAVSLISAAARVSGSHCDNGGWKAGVQISRRFLLFLGGLNVTVAELESTHKSQLLLKTWL